MIDRCANRSCHDWLYKPRQVPQYIHSLRACLTPSAMPRVTERRRRLLCRPLPTTGTKNRVERVPDTYYARPTQISYHSYESSEAQLPGVMTHDSGAEAWLLGSDSADNLRILVPRFLSFSASRLLGCSASRLVTLNFPSHVMRILNSKRDCTSV